MNDKAQEPRNYCECVIRELIDPRNPITDIVQWKNAVSVVLQQMHLRLTLLEGVDHRQLEDIECQSRFSSQ